MNFKQKHLLKMKMVAPQLHCLKTPQDWFHYLLQLSLQLKLIFTILNSKKNEEFIMRDAGFALLNLKVLKRQ